MLLYLSALLKRGLPALRPASWRAKKPWYASLMRLEMFCSTWECMSAYSGCSCFRAGRSMLRVYCEGSVGLRLQWWSRVLYTSLQWSRWRCRWFSCCLLGYSLYLNIRCIVNVLILELEKDFLRNSSTLQVGWSSCDHPIKLLMNSRDLK